MFENFDFWSIISIVLIVLGTFVGGWALIRGKISNLLKEVGDLASVLGKALEDNKITGDEKDALKKEYSEVKEAIQELVTKKPSPK